MPLIKKIFQSSTTSANPATSLLQVNIWPNIPQIELWTEDGGGQRNRVGPSVVFRGEDFGKFVQWIKEQGQ